VAFAARTRGISARVTPEVVSAFRRSVFFMNVRLSYALITYIIGYSWESARRKYQIYQRKKGKKRMKKIGKVDIPQEAFLAVLKK
jgi:hypothetical protein